LRKEGVCEKPDRTIPRLASGKRPKKGCVPSGFRSEDRTLDYGLLAAAWLSETSKGDPYIAVRLSSESQAQAEKIRLAIWKNHEWITDSDPHFKSVQEISGRDFTLQAWILTDCDKCRLALAIETVATSFEVSDALQNTRQRITDFLAHTGVAAMPPAEKVIAQLSAGDDKSEEPDDDDIPF